MMVPLFISIIQIHHINFHHMFIIMYIEVLMAEIVLAYGIIYKTMELMLVSLLIQVSLMIPIKLFMLPGVQLRY